MLLPRRHTAIATLFTVIGFILLVVATCSVPVNEDLYLFELRGTAGNETTIARIGVLGLCGDFKGRSRNGQWTDMHDCADQGLGFRITTTKAVRVSDNGRIVPVEGTVAKKEFTRALVFNPLAATFSAITAILCMFMLVIETSLCLSLCAFISLSISSAFAWIAFAINIAITLRSRSRVNDFATSPDQTVSLRIGPTSWISLGGAIALTIALLVWTFQHIRTTKSSDDLRDCAESQTQMGVKGTGQSSFRSTRCSTTPGSSRRQSTI